MVRNKRKNQYLNSAGVSTTVPKNRSSTEEGREAQRQWSSHIAYAYTRWTALPSEEPDPWRLPEGARDPGPVTIIK